MASIKKTIKKEKVEPNSKVVDNNILVAKKIWEMYDNGKDYQDSIGISKTIPKATRFFEGNQWGAVTEDTLYMPRPVFNICRPIVEHKTSNVMGEPVKINFIAEDNRDTIKVTRFSEWQQKEMNLEEYNSKVCTSAAVKGTGIWHFYWDETARGKKGNYEGAVRCQVIDPLKIIVSNPLEPDIQKQEWVIIESKEKVQKIKEICDADVDTELIEPDEIDGENDKDMRDNKKCTVLLRYFRINGEVYFEKTVKQTIVHHPIPYNPVVIFNQMEKDEFEKKRTKEILDSGFNDQQADDTPPTDLPDEKLESNFDDFDRIKADLYPLESFTWIDRDKCFYGIGEVEGIIPNQKAINFVKAMEILNFQELGMGKWIVKANALNGQEITNTPGEVLKDHTPGNFWGIQKVEGGQITSAAAVLASQIIDLTRLVTNSSDIITGDMVTRDMSGVAIAQLQSQQQKPIAQLQLKFRRSIARIGKILLQFYRLYYEDTDFTYDIQEDERLEEELKLKEATGNQFARVSKHKFDKFSGEEIRDKIFAITTEAGAGTRYSEIMALDTLKNLFMNGVIDSMSTERFEQMIELYPDSAMPFKSELKAIIRKQQASELTQYKQLAEQQGEQLNQVTDYCKSLEEVNQQLQEQIKQMQAAITQQNNNYQRKIKSQNELLGRMYGNLLMENENKKNQSKDLTETKTDSNGNKV